MHAHSISVNDAFGVLVCCDWQESLHLIHKFEAEQKQLFRDNVLDVAIESNIQSGSVPPKPVLVARSDTFMLFKPAKFKPANKQRVSRTECLKYIMMICDHTDRQGHRKVCRFMW